MMTNLTKEDFQALEATIDIFAKNKKLGSDEAKPYLDEYHEKIIAYFKKINGISDDIDFDNLDAYPVVPMNFKERYDYMIERKYHFMGYRQMKTFIIEIIKMNASYQTRLKNKKA
ncbi:hypothetical protein SASK122_15740 [Staphylococcus argenteus]|nr:hypothetical protein ERS140095_01159 [Staphylococcus argenteus]SGX04123.1 putative staphylococcal protein [Staphylococcus argenteus]SGX63422.1 putative staphylococcal protein [Staphylococcus argenteus]SHC24584.1 putative staphylococcal protein [Staphylococcus argenteus]SHD53172.1 putative staphylococcal protein [Staphylococcus argenteus]